ncbi:glycosyltransferase family 2 protein, partial [Candidatus Gottesmanbacteria bacterium]|nr:glycosyltransferase family 2 protein [Candidatus Gottesmanbacteria bacterium]
MKISAIIITRNEEENIEKCIESLSFVDEVIVVDNDSKDDTTKIAQKLGAKIYQVPGLDFSYLRNVGKEKAKGEWLLYIDADERVQEELAKELMERINNNPQDFSHFKLSRQNYYFHKLWPKREQMIRLMKKEALVGWQGSLHESPLVCGKLGKLVSPLLHYTHNDLSSMVNKTNQWSDIEATLRYKSNHPKLSWWRFFRIMMWAFWRSYISERGWQVGTAGLIESIYQAFSIFITYAKLWELQNKGELQNNICILDSPQRAAILNNCKHYLGASPKHS